MTKKKGKPTEEALRKESLRKQLEKIASRIPEEQRPTVAQLAGRLARQFERLREKMKEPGCAFKQKIVRAIVRKIVSLENEIAFLQGLQQGVFDDWEKLTEDQLLLVMQLTSNMVQQPTKKSDDWVTVPLTEKKVGRKNMVLTRQQVGEHCKQHPDRIKRIKNGLYQIRRCHLEDYLMGEPLKKYLASEPIQ
jgi:molybdopterin converting factor small subunit